MVILIAVPNLPENQNQLLRDYGKIMLICEREK